MILSGVLDRFPTLRILLAHSGGALPQLSSRLASCIAHDPVVASRLEHDARYYLGKLHYDAVAYGSEELDFVNSVIGRSNKYETGPSPEAPSQKLRGHRLLFGSDHPFFPPLSASEKWKSVVDNLDAIKGLQGWSEKEKDGIRGGNALALFELEV
jgi:predicted TIM-barrel fold metal-dependent hydrolase